MNGDGQGNGAPPPEDDARIPPGAYGRIVVFVAVLVVLVGGLTYACDRVA